MGALEKQVERLNFDLDKTSKELAELKSRSAPAAQGLQKIAVAAAKAAAAYFTVQKAAALAGNAIRESIARDTAEQQLSILAKQFGEVEGALLLTQRAAKKFGLGLTETTGQITQVYARLRPLGATLEEVEIVFNGFNTAARLGGSTAAEASGAFLQLSQALGSGYLRGQEFTSVAEQAPMVLQAIAKETNKTVGELKDFAAQGGITSDIVLRALKRIETEGAAQLAEAMNTPQQAIKDLQNAAEDLNVEVGRILQPVVLAFIRELTGTLKQATTQLNNATKAAEFLGTKLQPLVEIGNLVAGAFDGMGISLGNFVGEILKALPGIGQLIRAYETLAKVTEFFAGQQDNSKGGRNFGADYKAQEKALFAAAGGYTPYGSGAGLGGKGNESGTGGGKPAADEATRRLESMQEQLAVSEKLITAAERESELLKATTDEEALRIESKNKIFEIAEKYGELAAKSLSDAETENLLKAQGLEIQNERVALEEKLAEIEAKRFDSIDAEIAHMEAILAGTEQEYLLRKKIAELGGGPEAEAKVMRAAQLEKEVAAYKEMEQTVMSLSGTLAGELTSAFGSIIDGSKSAEEAMADMLQGIGKAFIDMALQIIQKQITMIIYGMIMKALGVSMPGSGFNMGTTPLGAGGGSVGGIGTLGPNFGLPANANGGFAPGGQPMLVGERGPELFMPHSDGRIVSNETMNNYRPNGMGAGGGGGGSVMVNYSGPQLNFNGDEYLPKSAVGEIINQAAMQGAQLGQARTVNSLRNNRSTRTRAGI